jgi:hypothetical protein
MRRAYGSALVAATLLLLPQVAAAQVAETTRSVAESRR